MLSFIYRPAVLALAESILRRTAVLTVHLNQSPFFRALWQIQANSARPSSCSKSMPTETWATWRCSCGLYRRGENGSMRHSSCLMFFCVSITVTHRSQRQYASRSSLIQYLLSQSYIGLRQLSQSHTTFMCSFLIGLRLSCLLNRE